MTRSSGPAGLRLLAVLAGAVLTLAVSAAPAAAHNTLRSTSPAGGQSVASTPGRVVLTFDEPAVALGTQVVVTGPSGPVQQGPARLVDNTVTQTLQSGAPAGGYTVTWRVTSIDGHPISGTFAFTSRTGSTAQSDTPASTPPPSTATTETPGWLVPVGAVTVVVLVASVIGLGRSRRRRGA